MDRKKWSAIERLVTEQPEKAKDILFQACEDTEVLVDVFATLTHAPANHQGHDQFNRPEPSRQMHDYGERPRSRASEPSHALQKLPRPYPPAMGQAPLSPPRTTSSVKSLSVKDDGTAAESVLLLVPTEQGDIQKWPIGMRTAPIQCSVIRQKAVHERNLTGSLEELADEYLVSIPRTEDFESFINVPVTESINLTWRRPRSNSTHATNFFVVPTHFLDTDIVLGTRVAGEATTEHSKYLNQMQRQQEYVAGGFGPRMYPAAPEAPTSRSVHPSVHQSAMHDDSSTRSTVRYPAPHQPRPQPPVQVGTVEEAVFANIQRQTGRPNAGSSVQISEVDPNKPAERLRLKIELGEGATPVQIWVDLAGPCDAFYKDFCKQVEKRGISFERGSASIVVRKTKEIANKEAYWIQLDEGTLEADWNDTVQYLETHKANTTPHLIGVLEIEDD